MSSGGHYQEHCSCSVSPHSRPCCSFENWVPVPDLQLSSSDLTTWFQYIYPRNGLRCDIYHFCCFQVFMHPRTAHVRCLIQPPATDTVKRINGMLQRSQSDMTSWPRPRDETRRRVTTASGRQGTVYPLRRTFYYVYDYNARSSPCRRASVYQTETEQRNVMA